MESVENGDAEWIAGALDDTDSAIAALVDAGGDVSLVDGETGKAPIDEYRELVSSLVAAGTLAQEEADSRLSAIEER